MSANSSVVKSQLRVQLVAVDKASDIWPRVSTFIKAALDQQAGDPEFSIVDIEKYVLGGQWHLFTISNPAAIIGGGTLFFFERPEQRVAFVPYMGGRWLSDPNVFAQFCSLLKELRVTHLEGGVNTANGRLWRRFGFTQKYQIIGVKL